MTQYDQDVPTLFRFGGYRVVMYSEDHEPAHVHVIGHGTGYVFTLNLPDGPQTLRRRSAGTEAEQRKTARTLTENLAILKQAWERAVNAGSEFEVAGERIDAMRREVPYAIAARYEPQLHRVLVVLNDHFEIAVDPERAGIARKAYKWSGNDRDLSIGYGLHFPLLDDDIYLPGLFQGIYGTAKWMRDNELGNSELAA